jgi:serine/threonine protein kinase
VDQVKIPEPATKRPPAPQAAKKPTARVGSNIKDNKETIPLGKRTNFGYERDFKQRYTLGKLLGHGQFGYTYVAIEKATGEKMAVKTIEKKQVNITLCCLTFFALNPCFYGTVVPLYYDSLGSPNFKVADMD